MFGSSKRKNIKPFASDLRPVTGEEIAAIVTRKEAYDLIARFLLACHRNVQPPEGQSNPEHYDLDLFKLSGLASSIASRDHRAKLVEPCLLDAAHQLCEEGWLRVGPKSLRFTQSPGAYGTCFSLTPQAIEGLYEVGYS